MPRSTAPEKSLPEALRRAAVHGLGWPAAGAWASVVWLGMFGPPHRATAWAGLAAAVVLPLGVAAWLGRRHPAWRMLALAFALPAAVAFLALIRDSGGDCVASCRAFSVWWQRWPAGQDFSWTETLISLVLWHSWPDDQQLSRVDLMCLFFAVFAAGLLLAFRGHRAQLRRPVLTLALCHLVAWAVVLEGAYLGHPVPGLPPDVSRSHVDRLLVSAHFESQRLPAKTANVSFALARRWWEVFQVELAVDEAGRGHLRSLRARYCVREKRVQVDQVDRDLSPSAARRLLKRLEATGLWQLEQAELGSAGLDGSSWLFELREADRHVKLDAWSPTYVGDHRAEYAAALGTAYRAGRILLATSGFTVCERELY